MKVTVIEQVEHAADITPEMVEAYLVQRNWICEYAGNYLRTYRHPSDRIVGLPGPMALASTEECAAVIETISRAEQRAPHLVLADIARGT